MDIKQQRAFRTFKRQRTVKTSSSTGFSGSGHQAAENSQDIKQKRFFRIRTSGGGGQTGHQTADDRRDIKQQRTTWTSSNKGHLGHQVAENSQDIKQKRFFRIRTSGGGGQSGHQAEKVFQDQDIRGRRTNGTSNSR